MTGYIAFQVVWAALTVGQVGLWLTNPPRPYLALTAGLLASACILTRGIIDHSWLVIGLGALEVAIAVALLLWWNGRGKHRKRVSREIGDESRQVRDALVRRARIRPGLRRSPSPRVSP
jgi:hypothetical protein